MDHPLQGLGRADLCGAIAESSPLIDTPTSNPEPAQSSRTAAASPRSVSTAGRTARTVARSDTRAASACSWARSTRASTASRCSSSPTRAAASGGDQEALALTNFTTLSTLVVFAAMSILLLTLFGTTIGRRIVGVGITATGERSWPWFVSMTVRTLLLCLVIPAVVYDRDTRGLHDRAAGTVATRY